VLTIEKDANGEPTGVFIEGEMQPIAELIWFRQAAGFTRAHRARVMPMSAAAYHAFGTTSVFEEHGVANELLRAYKDAYRDVRSRCVRHWCSARTGRRWARCLWAH
jgi:predicted amidohydrolase YtcJ